MAIVCVNYHSERHCSELYDTLLTQNDPAWELVIVDNGSGDDRALLDELAARERVRVVRPDNNLGYFNGAQFGVDDLRVGPAAPEWIVVCNPDIRFDDAGFVAHLRRRDADEPLVLAPSVVSPVMGEQNPFMSSVPSRGRTALRTAVLSSHLLGRLAGTYSTAVTGRRRRSIAPTPPTQPEQRIFAPHGSVIVFSRGYFTAGLDVHHERFLYGEEVAVARRCWERGVPVVYDPAARVRHLGHATTGRMPSRELTRRKREGVWFVQRELAHVRRARGAASERATP